MLTIVRTTALTATRRPALVCTAIRCFSSADTTKKIEKLIDENKVVVFMKGVHGAPRCGFSNAVSMVLAMHGVDFKSVDVLSDEELRQGIKDYTNWPTIPQVFIDKQFVGGCDIILQMHQNGQLIETLKKAGIKSALESANEKPEEKS
ncbi:glutaredoxin-related protein 5-like protein [Dinothrombium tinctorium]|uniref:Glutaredoxin-related protein 5, mitochondrial n=1 Tax=Dinothrombium tinctorium TaxID=1965070 RepID=A0A3S3PT48_9ACAR|nr:glutaredoxin-related protein 5-like protein [Dinothrombium tinctorium]